MSSPKIRSSPVKKSQATGNHQNTSARSAGIEKSARISDSVQAGAQLQATQRMHSGIKEPVYNSPRQEFICKMRNSEEETLTNGQGVIRRIRAAMAKARKISMEVQSGISELEELIDIMRTYRTN